MQTNSKLIRVFLSVFAAIVAITVPLTLKKWLFETNGSTAIELSRLPRASATVPQWLDFSRPEFGFSVQFPAPVKHSRKSVPTPYGDAPLEVFASTMGAAQFTIAVTEYDPRLATEFSDAERFESQARETPKRLGGTLIENEPIVHNGVTGRDQIVEVQDKAILHSRVFLIGNRSYQAQVVYPHRGLLDKSTEDFFLNSFEINSVVPEK
jgi:hypothetical protein